GRARVLWARGRHPRRYARQLERRGEAAELVDEPLRLGVGAGPHLPLGGIVNTLDGKVAAPSDLAHEVGIDVAELLLQLVPGRGRVVAVRALDIGGGAGLVAVPRGVQLGPQVRQHDLVAAV